MDDLLIEAAGFCHTLHAVLALFSLSYSEFLWYLKEIFTNFKGVNYSSNRSALWRFKSDRFAILFVVCYLFF